MTNAQIQHLINRAKQLAQHLSSPENLTPEDYMLLNMRAAELARVAQELASVKRR